MTFNLGDRPTITFTFTASGALADPSRVTFQIKGTTYTWNTGDSAPAKPYQGITKASLGTFSIQVPLTASGGFPYVWQAFDADFVTLAGTFGSLNC